MERHNGFVGPSLKADMAALLSDHLESILLEGFDQFFAGENRELSHRR